MCSSDLLGADDELLPNAVHTYLDFLQKKECRNFDIISGKSFLVDENNNVLGTFGKKCYGRSCVIIC